MGGGHSLPNIVQILRAIRRLDGYLLYIHSNSCCYLAGRAQEADRQSQRALGYHTGDGGALRFIHRRHVRQLDAVCFAQYDYYREPLTKERDLSTGDTYPSTSTAITSFPNHHILYGSSASRRGSPSRRTEDVRDTA